MFNKISIFIFVIWMVSPLATLLVSEHNKSIGFAKVKPLDNLVGDVISGDSKKLNDVFKGIFERSKMTSYAIKTKNSILFNWFGHVDNSDLVSGRDGWLFYKPQFTAQKCEKNYYRNGYVYAANSAALFEAMAETVGIKVIYSISPNKFRIEKQGVDKRVLAYAGCQTENEDLFDSILSSRIPSLVLHHEAIKDAPKNDYPFYYKNNTHWNFNGYAAAMLQMKYVIERGAKLPEWPELKANANEVEAVIQDTTKNLLLIDVVEEGPILEPNIFEGESHKYWPINYEGEALIIHDSFYNTYKYTKDVFGDRASLININNLRPREKIIDQIQKHPDLIVFNTAERAAAVRLQKSWGVHGDFFKPIMVLNRRKAEKECFFESHSFKAEHKPFNEQADIKDVGVLSAKVDNPRVTVIIPKEEGFQCLFIKLESPRSTVLDLMLTPLSNQDISGGYELGRYFPVNVERGDNSIKLILPKDLVSGQINIRPRLKAGETLKGLEFRTKPYRG